MKEIMEPTTFDHESALKAVVKVGDGRGFIIETLIWNYLAKRYGKERFILTAGHCLPKLPPAHVRSFVHEKTYPLIGRLNLDELPIMTECLFVNPVADIAILGKPDGQVSEEYSDHSERFDELVYNSPFFRIGQKGHATGWILSLDGYWKKGKIEFYDPYFSFTGPEIIGGMSGSPVLNNDGHAIGLINSASGKFGEKITEAYSVPLLTEHLPGWILGKGNE